MNIDKYINMNRKEFLEFLELDHLIPIDDIIEYKGKKYKLSKQSFDMLSSSRLKRGYNINYLNPIDKKIANEINMGTLGALTIIKDEIENDLKLGNPVRYKEING